MLDDLRNHDAMPTDEERSWMEADPLAGLSRALLLVAFAVGVGFAASFLAAPGTSPSIAAVGSPAAR